MKTTIAIITLALAACASSTLPAPPFARPGDVVTAPDGTRWRIDEIHQAASGEYYVTTCVGGGCEVDTQFAWGSPWR